MYNTHNLGKLKETILIGRLLRGSILALALFVLTFAIVPNFIAEANAAERINTEIDWGSVFLTLDPDVEATNAAMEGGSSRAEAIAETGHGDIDFSTIIPTARTDSNRGTMKVMKKKIGVETTGKYYTIYLSTTSSDNNLNLVSTTDGETQINTSFNIPATTATFGSPAILGSTASWGYAIPGTTILPETGSVAPTFYVPQLINAQIYSTTEGEDAQQTYNSTVWAGVPGNTAPQQIWKAETNKIGGFGYSFSARLSCPDFLSKTQISQSDTFFAKVNMCHLKFFLQHFSVGLWS